MRAREYLGVAEVWRWFGVGSCVGEGREGVEVFVNRRGNFFRFHFLGFDGFEGLAVAEL